MEPNRKPNCNCGHCGKPIYRRPSALKRLKNKPCCSTRCANLLRGCEHLRNPKALTKRAESIKGENNPCWRGGRYIEPGKGYVMVRMPNHPRARQNGYVLEHILVGEKILGRPLKTGEEIHHKNDDRADNRPENLEIYSSHSSHWSTHHLPLRPKAPPCKCGRPHTAKGMCSRCYAYWRRTGAKRFPVDKDLRS